MRRIEFIGANGVGKTTLLKQTIELLESDCLEQTQARAELAWRQFDESGLARKWISQLKWRAMARRPRRIKSQRNQALQQALASDNPELIGFCDLVLRIVTDSLLTIMQKQRVLSWFYDALYDALYFDASDCCTGALCDESIGLKTLMIAMLASSQAEAERLFELMPLPSLSVNVVVT